MFIADFHIHSKYSRATSRDCVPEMLELWARRKGLDLIGTGDFTHAKWREELKEKLIPAEEGLYTLKEDSRLEEGRIEGGGKPRFILSGEISSIYKKNGRVRKVHNVILMPSLEAAQKLSERLEAIGNLHSDGRPILGLDSRDLLEITLEAAPDAIFIPAHIWTPHFSLFGAYSGFDDIKECFEDLTEHIHALETGLSSDPPMNWRVSALDGFTLVSNSDAHSPAKLAREANLFDTALSYPDIARALDKSTDGFRGTIEFFPEEGKYHYDGHRKCSVCQKPAETKTASGVCPVCGKRITVGVLHRVEELADRGEGFTPDGAKPFESLVPLNEIIACSMGMTVASKKVAAKYFDLIAGVGPELYVLREAPMGDIANKAGTLLAEGIRRLRQREVEIQPGFDGQYGKIKIFDEKEIRILSGQISLFTETKEPSPSKKQAPERTQKAAPEKTLSENTEDTREPKTAGEDIPYGLNGEQWEAVSSAERAVAVIAGPGTGKTRTLISRIAYLVENRSVPPSNITAVTFTNKAAGEMRTRLKEQFPGSRAAGDMNIGTFHSICLKLLRDGGASSTVIDEQSALGIMGGILKKLGEKSSPRDMLRVVSLMKNGACPEENNGITEKVREMYDGELMRYGALDFDDILINTLALLADGSLKSGPSFRHILVDEFQDINPVQYRLVKEWGRVGDGIFVIGDPAQSIYGFRGSDPRCFDSFFEDYPSARKIELTQNYRSTPEILGCAQPVVERRSALAANKASGAKVRLLTAKDTFSEALFVAKEINRMVGGMDMLEAHAAPASDAPETKRGFSDIAVLYRTNRQAHALEQCLKKEDIPYIVSGRDDFLSDAGVRAALAFFRFLINRADILSLKAYLEAAVKPSELADKILADYAASDKSRPALSGILGALETDMAAAIPALIGQLEKYAPAAAREKPCTLLESWACDNALFGSPGMEMLINTSVMYGDMASLLKNLTLGQDSDVRRSGKRSYFPDAVSLMTLHCSKGLEYPTVFLCGVSDGLIPFRNRGGDCNLDEERRLFYVGVTRAKDELILLSPLAASPFVEDFPKEHHVKGNALPPRPGAGSKQLSLF